MFPSPAVALNVRDVNIGSPDDPSGKNTIIGLLKSIILLLGE